MIERSKSSHENAESRMLVCKSFEKRDVIARAIGVQGPWEGDADDEEV